jgi:diacylglycerol kinase (ATP)
MKIRLVINPKAGVYVKSKLVHPRLEDYFAGSGHDVDSVETTKSGDGEEIAQESAKEGFDVVVGVGGDGTLNDIAHGLVQTDTALGVIPMGSGNGFARHYEIPLSVPLACKALWDPKFRTIDVGQINERIFLVTCGLGLDADISFSMEKTTWRGLLAYFWHGMVGLADYRAPEVLVAWDDNMIRTKPLLLTVCNLSQYGGGFRIAPGAKGDDGKLDLCWIPPLGTLPSIWNLPRVFGGSATQVPGYQRQLVKKVRLIRDHAGPAHVDGDPFWADTELNIKVLHKVLKVALPSKSFKRVIIPTPILPEQITKSFQEFRESLDSLLAPGDRDQSKNQKSIDNKGAQRRK